MIGRHVSSAWHRVAGEVVKWEPLGAGLTDALVRRDDGTEIWLASHELIPVDGKGPLPRREDARVVADLQAERSLQAILKRHVDEFHVRWFGMEFAKAWVGNAIVGALDDVQDRLGRE